MAARAPETDDRRVVVQHVTGWDRLVARCRATRLDRALADGASPDDDVALTLRARLLLGRPLRGELAADLRSLVAMAWDPSPPRHGWGPVCRRRLREVTGELLGLARLLDAPGPVGVRGVALARLLLTDGAGPLYGLGDEPLETLVGAVHEARAALGVGPYGSTSPRRMA
jgi:hypothetical protein